MPTYEYACDACGHKFEEFQSIKAKPISVCPKCGKKKVKRLISAGAGFIFKGSGFYETDYRSESYKNAAKADTAPAPAAATSGGDAKTESKTSSKADSSPKTTAESKPATKAKSGAK